MVYKHLFVIVLNILYFVYCHSILQLEASEPKRVNSDYTNMELTALSSYASNSRSIYLEVFLLQFCNSFAKRYYCVTHVNCLYMLFPLFRG